VAAENPVVLICCVDHMPLRLVAPRAKIRPQFD
jgi:hypothetical protein